MRRSFQSPSLRGSGRFLSAPLAARRGGKEFNPLHCGAVVASRLRGPRRVPSRHRFNPLHCGAVVASLQTLLRLFPRFEFNPLHCGAVVASPSGLLKQLGANLLSIPFIAGQWSLPLPALDPERSQRLGLNPLHCGAVVASCSARTRSGSALSVSIPFIAGQWSLLAPRRMAEGQGGCLNPLHCGAVVASWQWRSPPRRRTRVSIPFIAGQWSLPQERAQREVAARASQSPSLRGSGRFAWRRGKEEIMEISLNPLHCGAVVASAPAAALAVWRAHVSIPFIAGQWSLLKRQDEGLGEDLRFQSPSLRGSGRFPIIR